MLSPISSSSPSSVSSLTPINDQKQLSQSPQAQSLPVIESTPPELRQTPQDAFRKALVGEGKIDVCGRWLGEEMDLPKIPPPLKEHMREKFSEPIELVEGQKSPFIPLKFLQHTVYCQKLFTIIKVLVPGSSIRSFFIYKFKGEGNRDTSYLDLCMQGLGIQKWLTDELRNGIPIESQDFDVRIEGVPTNSNVKDLFHCLTYAISQAVSILVGQEVKLDDDVITNKGKCFSHVQFGESAFEVVFSNLIPRPFQSPADNLTCSLTGGKENWSFEQALVCPGQHTLQPILDIVMRVVYLYRPEQLNDRCLKFFALMARMWTVEGSVQEMEQLIPKKHVFEERLKDVFEKHCTKKNIDFAYTTLIHLWFFQSIRPNPDDPEKQIPPFKEMVDILESMIFFKEVKEKKPSAPVKHLKTLLTGASEEATKDLLTFLEVAAFSSIHGEGSPIRWTQNFRGPAFSWAFSEAEKGKSSPGLAFPFSLDRAENEADYKKIFAQLKNLEESYTEEKQQALAGLWKCLHPHSQLFGAKRPFSAKKLFHNLVKTSLNSQHPCAPDLVKRCFPFIADELSLEEWRELDLLSPPISQYPYTPQLLESSLPHIADKLALEDWKLLGGVFPRLFSQQLCRKEIREKFIKQKQLRELLVLLADTLDVESFRQLTGFWDDLPEYFTSFFADWLRANKTDRAAEWVAQREDWAAELNSQECINWIQWLVWDQKQLDESSPQLTKWLAPLFEEPEEGAKWIQAYPRLFIEKLDFLEEHPETREFRQKYTKALAYYYSLLTQVTIADYPPKLRVAWERYHPEDDIVAIRFNRMAGEKLNEEQFLDLLKLIKVMKAPKAEHWQRLLTAASSLKSAEIKQKVLSLIFKNMKKLEDWQALNPSEEVTKNLAQLIGNFPKACWKISSDWRLYLAPFWSKEKILTIVFHCPQKALEEHRHVLKTLLGMAIGSFEDARKFCPETVLSEEKRQRWEKLSALFSDKGEKVEEVEEVEEEEWTIGDSIQWVLNRHLYLAGKWNKLGLAASQPKFYLGSISKEKDWEYLDKILKAFHSDPESEDLLELLIAFSTDYDRFSKLWEKLLTLQLSEGQLKILYGEAVSRWNREIAQGKESLLIFKFFEKQSKKLLHELLEEIKILDVIELDHIFHLVIDSIDNHIKSYKNFSFEKHIKKDKRLVDFVLKSTAIAKDDLLNYLILYIFENKKRTSGFCDYLCKKEEPYFSFFQCILDTKQWDAFSSVYLSGFFGKKRSFKIKELELYIFAWRLIKESEIFPDKEPTNQKALFFQKYLVLLFNLGKSSISTLELRELFKNLLFEIKDQTSPQNRLDLLDWLTCDTNQPLEKDTVDLLYTHIPLKGISKRGNLALEVSLWHRSLNDFNYLPEKFYEDLNSNQAELLSILIQLNTEGRKKVSDLYLSNLNRLLDLTFENRHSSGDELLDLIHYCIDLINSNKLEELISDFLSLTSFKTNEGLYKYKIKLANHTVKGIDYIIEYLNKKECVLGFSENKKRQEAVSLFIDYIDNYRKTREKNDSKSFKKNICLEDIDEESNDKLINKMKLAAKLFYLDVSVTIEPMMGHDGSSEVFHLMREVITKSFAFKGLIFLKNTKIFPRNFKYTGKTQAEDHLEVFSLLAQEPIKLLYLLDAINSLRIAVRDLREKKIKNPQRVLAKYQKYFPLIREKFIEHYSRPIATEIAELWALCYINGENKMALSGLDEKFLIRLAFKSACEGQHAAVSMSMHNLINRLNVIFYPSGKRKGLGKGFFNREELKYIYLCLFISCNHTDVYIEKHKASKEALSDESKKVLKIMEGLEKSVGSLRNGTRHQLSLIDLCLGKQSAHEKTKFFLGIIDQIYLIKPENKDKMISAYWGMCESFKSIIGIYRNKTVEVKGEQMFQILKYFLETMKDQKKASVINDILTHWKSIKNEIFDFRVGESSSEMAKKIEEKKRELNEIFGDGLSSLNFNAL